MAKAFKCDSCGEYADGEPMIVHMIPPSLTEKRLQYDLCPYCANEVVEALTHEKGECKIIGSCPRCGAKIST